MQMFCRCLDSETQKVVSDLVNLAFIGQKSYDGKKVNKHHQVQTGKKNNTELMLMNN